MNATQIASFEQGAGSFFTAAQLLNLIQSVGAVILLTYVAWLCVNTRTMEMKPLVHET